MLSKVILAPNVLEEVIKKLTGFFNCPDQHNKKDVYQQIQAFNWSQQSY